MVEECIKLEQLQAKQAKEAKSEPKQKKPAAPKSSEPKSKKSQKDEQKRASQNDESEPIERTFGELKNILRNSTTMDLAKKIIGVNLCRRIDGQKIIGRIVDTEAYIGPVDKCSVTFKKKKSKALASYFAESGTACVEFVEEGNTHLAISSALPGEYVLISALQPMLGREKMKSLRGMRPSTTDKNLTATAKELAAALKVTMEFDGLDLLEGGGDIWLEPGVTCPKVVKTRRAIDMNNEKNWQEWSFKKLRFYSATSHCIKTRDQKEEQNTVLQTLPEDVDHI
ncbi:Oidioi.mRNA.OKI2018_I69.XSR.g14671.t1.cds [Oikopleura dioica]|uniref:DNA-3-methyladenine glycosylase II n=1 Tax=Oikopleura dioica TaxID=34765 RepID=A0ABN7SFH2_OIKDI|nr:Oidioi.mRNA.OKI2018_I69.XSR.g14671.t1.cds [Oikopleura dioica]